MLQPNFDIGCNEKHQVLAKDPTFAALASMTSELARSDDWGNFRQRSRKAEGQTTSDGIVGLGHAARAAH